MRANRGPLARRQLLTTLGAAGGLATLGTVVAAAAPAKSKSKKAPPGPPPPPTAAERRAQLYGLLGELPDIKRVISHKKRKEEEKDGYILETLDLDLNGIETVPAYLARPKRLTGRAPAILFNHSHGGGYTIGKKELVDGRSYMTTPSYAKALTDQGYIVLGIDHWVFGERATATPGQATEQDTFKLMLWRGQVMWGMMVYDTLRALDYLVSRPDVNANKVATLGISMGSTMAWWAAALDERITATVDICCLTDFQTLIDKKGLGRHGIYYYVPGLLKHFTTAQINELIVPRPHLAIAGTRDALTPVEGLERIDHALQTAYAAAGKPDHWKLSRFDVFQQETPQARKEILEFLKKHLATS